MNIYTRISNLYKTAKAHFKWVKYVFETYREFDPNIESSTISDTLQLISTAWDKQREFDNYRFSTEKNNHINLENNISNNDSLGKFFLRYNLDQQTINNLLSNCNDVCIDYALSSASLKEPEFSKLIVFSKDDSIAEFPEDIWQLIGDSLIHFSISDTLE